MSLTPMGVPISKSKSHIVGPSPLSVPSITGVTITTKGTLSELGTTSATIDDFGAAFVVCVDAPEPCA